MGMKLPPFTLVHSRATPRPKGAPRLPKAVSGAKTNLQATLATSFASGVLGAGAFKRVSQDLGRREKVETVGIWDLGAWVGSLPKIIEAMNRAQPAIVIFDVQAAAPAGLRSRKERVILWAERVVKKKLRKPERDELTDAIIDVDFFPPAEFVRKDLGIDYLIGLTAEPIAGEIEYDQGDRRVHSDFFWSMDRRIGLVSTSGLRKLAAKANRPFEFAAAYVFLASLLTAMNPKLVVHEENRGCLLDYNEDRRTIVRGFKSPMIEDSCMRKIKPAYRDMTTALLRALQHYQEATSQ